VRVSNSHGSSLHNASREMRLFKATELAVQLSLTLRMKKLTVGCTVGSTHQLGDHVMAVPSGFLSDGFATCAHTPRENARSEAKTINHNPEYQPERNSGSATSVNTQNSNLLRDSSEGRVTSLSRYERRRSRSDVAGATVTSERSISPGLSRRGGGELPSTSSAEARI
jgi:hypothetical protein